MRLCDNEEIDNEIVTTHTSSRACEGSPECGIVLNPGDPSQARDDVLVAILID